MFYLIFPSFSIELAQVEVTAAPAAEEAAATAAPAAAAAATAALAVSFLPSFTEFSFFPFRVITCWLWTDSHLSRSTPSDLSMVLFQYRIALRGFFEDGRTYL